MAKKKFFIINQGPILFSNNGKKRVRVFQEGDDPPSAAETQASTEAIKDNTEAQNENTEAQNENTESTESQTQAVTQLSDAQKKLREEIANVSKEFASRYDQLVKEGKITDENSKLLGTYLKAKADLAKAEQDGVADTEAYQKAVDAAKASLESAGKELVEFADGLEDAAQKSELMAFAIDRAGDALGGLSTVLSFAGAESVAFGASLMGNVSQLSTIGLELDTVNKELQINSGLGSEAATMMTEMIDEGVEFGVTMERAGKAITALNKDMSSFIELSPDMRKDLANQVAQFENLGASSEAQAKALDVFAMSMAGVDSTGKRVTTGMDTLMPRLDDLAVKLSLPTGQIIEDFGKLGPQMARFGKDGVKKFEDLAGKARSLGITIEEAFNIGEAMDTFEGAADMAGKLNAQLGLQLNSVNLLKEDHAGRIQLLQDEFRARSKNFDQMHRRERQAVAEMLGVDVDVAAKIFGDPIAYEQYQRQQATAAERTATLTTMQNKLSAAAEKVMVALQPLANVIAGIATALAESGILTAISYFTIFIGTALGLVNGFMKLKAMVVAYQQARAAGNVLETIGIKLGVIKAATNKAEEESQEDLNDAQEKGNQGGKEFAITLAAIGAALLMIGTGIYMASTGLATLVTAFGDIANAGFALAAITVIMAGFVGMVYILAGASIAAAGPIMGLGFAILMIGGGVALAAAGMALLVTAFGSINPDVVLPIASAIGAFSLSIYGLIVSLASLAAVLANPIGGTAMLWALGALSLALGGLGLAMAGISEGAAGLDSLSKVIEVTTKTSPEQLEGLQGVLTQIAEVQMQSQFANPQALDAIAKLFGSGGGADANMSTEKDVKLMLNERELGNVIVDVVKNRFDVTPA
jgi:hypothetical protein